MAVLIPITGNVKRGSPPKESGVPVLRGIPESVRDLRVTRKYLRELTHMVDQFLPALDKIMSSGTPSEKRGKQVAFIANQLDMANQIAKRFGGAGKYRK